MNLFHPSHLITFPQETRKAIDLEGHWSKEYRPFVPFEPNPIQYEKEFSKLLDKFPAPNDYVQVEGPKLKGKLPRLTPSFLFPLRWSVIYWLSFFSPVVFFLLSYLHIHAYTYILTYILTYLTHIPIYIFTLYRN